MNMHNPAMALTEENAGVTPPGVLAAGHFAREFGYRVRRRAGTSDWLVTFTIAGSGRYRLGRYEQACESGRVMLLEPGTPHDYATAERDQAWDFYWSHFLPRPHWLPWLQWPHSAPGLRSVLVADPATYGRLESCFRRLLREMAGLDAWRDELAGNALEEALLLIARAHGRSTQHTVDPRVDLILQVLSQRYQEPLTVTALAEMVGLSPSRLAHLFKETIGEPIVQTILSLRLRQAMRLLEFTTLPVNEIAAQVGFDSPFYFSRQFRARYGASPSAFRTARQAPAAALVSTQGDGASRLSQPIAAAPPG